VPEIKFILPSVIVIAELNIIIIFFFVIIFIGLFVLVLVVIFCFVVRTEVKIFVIIDVVFIVIVIFVIIGENDQVIEVVLVLHAISAATILQRLLKRHLNRCGQVGRLGRNRRGLPGSGCVVVVVKQHFAAHIFGQFVEPKKRLGQLTRDVVFLLF
jgi:hypothetical protein